MVIVFLLANGNTKIFVTIPRFVDGIPGTLNTVSQNEKDGNPLLEPYPSWEWNSNSAQCSDKRLVSVFRTQVKILGIYQHDLWYIKNSNVSHNYKQVKIYYNIW